MIKYVCTIINICFKFMNFKILCCTLNKILHYLFGLIKRSVLHKSIQLKTISKKIINFNNLVALGIHCFD